MECQVLRAPLREAPNWPNPPSPSRYNLLEAPIHCTLSRQTCCRCSTAVCAAQRHCWVRSASVKGEREHNLSHSRPINTLLEPTGQSAADKRLCGTYSKFLLPPMLSALSNSLCCLLHLLSLPHCVQSAMDRASRTPSWTSQASWTSQVWSTVQRCVASAVASASIDADEGFDMLPTTNKQAQQLATQPTRKERLALLNDMGELCVGQNGWAGSALRNPCVSQSASTPTLSVAPPCFLVSLCCCVACRCGRVWFWICLLAVAWRGGVGQHPCIGFHQSAAPPPPAYLFSGESLDPYLDHSAGGVFKSRAHCRSQFV